MGATKKRFLSGYEQQTFAEDKRALEKSIADPHCSDRPLAKKTLERIVRTEMDQSPPDLTPAQRDQAKKAIDELEPKIREGMLSAEEMRRNPPGAVSQNVKWSQANKDRIRRWRNALRALNRGESKERLQDLCNVERLRPRSSHLSMAGAEIPATRAFSMPPDHLGEKAGWPYVDVAPPDPEIEAKSPEEMSFEELEEATRPEETDALGG